MPFYYTPFIILPFLSFIVNAGLAAYSWHRRQLPAALPLVWLMVGMSGWPLAYALNTAATTLAMKVFFYKMGTSFVCLIPPTVVALAIESIGRSDWLTRGRLAGLSVVPVLSVVLVWSNDLHFLFRGDLHLNQNGPLLLLGFENGPYANVHLFYVILANVAAIIMFVWALWRSPRGLSLRYALLIAATVIPILVEVLSITPVKGFSMTTSSLFLSGSAYALAIFRYRLLDIVPLARTVLFAQIGDPVLVFDTGGALVDCNNSARGLAGSGLNGELSVVRQCLLSRFPGLELHCDPPGDVPRHSYLTDTTDPDIHWSVTCSRLQAGGTYRGLLIQLHDISDLKKAERDLLNSQQHLRELNSTLQERVEAETARRLERERMLANHARLVAMGEMLAAVAHQWRQPLSTVGMVVQNIRTVWDAGRLDRDYLDGAVETAMKQIHLMSETIDTFRRFFRPDKQKETLDVAAQIREALSIMGHQLADVHISLHLPEQDRRLPAVSGFPNEFTQVLVNLLSNARDAIEERRRLEPGAPGEIAIAIHDLRDAVEIRVRDSGCGIAPEGTSRIFEPYYTTKQDKEGTGIGLYMSRMIIEESMGGRLSFASKWGETDFAIVLPVSEGA